MIVSISPLVSTITVIRLSLVISSRLYITFTSALPPSCLVISFSSGIIILFCYCAIMAKYEKSIKRKKSKKIIFVFIIFLWLFVLKSENFGANIIKEVCVQNSSPILTCAIIIVILCALRINKRIFKPEKTFLGSF